MLTPEQLLGQSFPVLVLAGLLAALAMASFSLLCKRLGIIPVNSIRAIGSLLTGSLDSGLLAGWALHLFAGVVFGFAYISLMRLLEITDRFSLFAACFFVSLVHGVVVGVLLIISVGEHHHIKRYRDNGFGIVAVNVLAHLLFGSVLAAILSMAS